MVAGYELEQLRLRQDMTPEQLAVKTGFTKRYLSAKRKLRQSPAPFHLGRNYTCSRYGYHIICSPTMVTWNKLTLAIPYLKEWSHYKPDEVKQFWVDLMKVGF